MIHFGDPGEQERGSKRRSGLKTPEPMSLFDISNKPPPTPFQVTSPTSIQAAAEMPEDQRNQRRAAVFRAILGSGKDGIARFQIAERLRVPDHWVSSGVNHLIKMRRVEEHKTRTVLNPASGKACAILLAIDSGEMEGAA